MALSRVKTWIAGETLTAADLNAEFSNIIDNATTLISPATATFDLNGNVLIFDSDGDTTVTADTDDRLDFALSGTDLFRMDGTATTPVNGLTFVARATGSVASIQALASDANVGFDLRDDNGNEILILTGVASAVNEITITNAAAASEPSISATGTDTDIDIKLTPKGAGGVNITAGALTLTSGSLNLTAGAINEAEASNVASATTTNIWATDGSTVHVTGTTTITSFGTAPNAGAWRKVIFDDALTLTDGANLNLPGGANITTAADDFAFVYAETTTLFKALYFKADGSPVAGGMDVQTFTASGTWTKPSGASRTLVMLWAGGGSGGRGSTAGCGGGGGGFVMGWFAAGTLGATETVTIGAGGAAKTANGSGNAGGNSTFGSLLTSYGGGGGETGVEPGGGGGGSLSAGDLSGDGGDPDGGVFVTVTVGEGSSMGGGAGGGDGRAGGPSGWGGGGGGGQSGAGGASIYGGGGGGGEDNTTGGAGGVSVLGGNGGQGGSAGGVGGNGSQPGGGGGGSDDNTSGAGGDGQCIVITWS